MLLEYPYGAAYGGWATRRYARLESLVTTDARPPVMTDSTADGTLFQQGEAVYDTDYNQYKTTLIDPELPRAPKAVVNAAMSRVGDHMHFDINVQNLSGVTLSSANSAYVTAIVYEDVTHLPPPDNLTDTNRIVRVAPEQAITSLENGAWGNFSIDTIDLWGYNWNNLHGVVVVDYMPGDTGQPYWDMLQGAIASSSIPPVSVNHPPTLNAIQPVTMPEDSATYSVPLAGISAGSGDTGQQLTITAKSSDPTIFPDPQVSYTSPNTIGSLAITPLPNRFGVVTVTVTVKDNGGTTNGGIDTSVRTFLVTVTPVNDPPTIHAFPVFGVRGKPLAFSAQEFRDAYTDAENDPLAAVKFLSLPPSGTLALNGTPVTVGSAIPASQLDGLVFLPAAGWYGMFDLSWTASDGTSYAVQPAVLTVSYPYTAMFTYLPVIAGPAASWNPLVSQSFEGAFPGGWQLFSSFYDYDTHSTSDVTSLVSWGKRNCHAASGAYGGWAVGGGSLGITKSCQDSYPGYIETWMTYSPLNLSQVKDGVMTLKFWSDTEYEYDYMAWGVSLDGKNYYGTSYTGNSNGWLTDTIDLKNVYTLGNVTGAAQVWVGVWFVSDGGNTAYEEGAAVDNILVSTCTSLGGCAGTPSLASVNQIPDTLKVSPVYHYFRESSQVALQSALPWPEVRQQR